MMTCFVLKSQEMVLTSPPIRFLRDQESLTRALGGRDLPEAPEPASPWQKIQLFASVAPELQWGRRQTAIHPQSRSPWVLCLLWAFPATAKLSPAVGSTMPPRLRTQGERMRVPKARVKTEAPNQAWQRAHLLVKDLGCWYPWFTHNQQIYLEKVMCDLLLYSLNSCRRCDAFGRICNHKKPLTLFYTIFCIN